MTTTLRNALNIIILIAIVGGIGYFFYYTRQQKVEKIQTDTSIDQQIVFSGDIVSGEIIEAQPIIDKLIVNENEEKKPFFQQYGFDDVGLGDDDNNTDFKKLYQQSIEKGDIAQQIFILEKYFQKTQDAKVLYILVDKLVLHFEFDKALEYMRPLLRDPERAKEIHTQSFLYVLFNSFEFNFGNIQNIRTLLRAYQTEKSITEEDYYFYLSLLDLLKLDTDQFSKKINDLKGKKYENIKKNINSNLAEFKKFKGVPIYYLYSLFSLTLYQEGYYKIAQKLAEESLKKNGQYILPHQILGYTHFVMNDFKKANTYFLKLTDLDKPYKEIYVFLLGVSNYWLGEYDNSILYLQQLEKTQRQTDIYRYLLLNSIHQKNNNNIIRYAQKLLGQAGLTEYDYYTLFDAYFFDTVGLSEKFSLYEKNPQLVNDYIDSCFKTLSINDQFICKYGKAGTYLANGDQKNALKYLLYLTRYYPKSFIFHAIANIYLQNDQIDKAKAYFVRTIVSSQSVDEKKYVKGKLTSLLSQSQSTGNSLLNR